MNWLSDTSLLVLSVVLFCAAAACGWMTAFLINDSRTMHGVSAFMLVFSGLFMFAYGTLLAYEAWTLL